VSSGQFLGVGEIVIRIMHMSEVRSSRTAEDSFQTLREWRFAADGLRAKGHGEARHPPTLAGIERGIEGRF
jgi:hypothetical protein